VLALPEGNIPRNEAGNYYRVTRDERSSRLFF
jgi:hypothetical protein